MSKPFSLGLALLCLILLACGPAPAPAASPPLQAAVPVAAAEPDAAQIAAEGEAPEAGPVPVSAADPSWGRRDALVTIVEFADFQCPFCGRAESTLRQLREKYGQETLRLVWKNNPLPFHNYAQPAAVAAMVLHERFGNDGFWAAHDAFFGEQGRLGDLPAEVGTRLGLPPGELSAPSVRRNAEAKIEADMALAKQLGATGTPAFFLNGVFLSGAQPFDKFAAVIDAQIQKANELVAAGTPRRRLYVALATAQWKAQPPPSTDTAKKEEEDRTVHRVPVGHSAARGGAAAPVTIVEFADFQCPFCVRVEPTLQQVTAQYGAKVRLVWKHNPLPFHPRAEPAAELTMEARLQKGDKGFWAAHDLLLQTDNARNLTDPDLLGYAKSLGLDAGRVAAAIAGKKHAAEIEADLDLSDDLQANGTPHFFINGRRLVGAQPFEKFKAVIDEELAKAEALIKGGVPGAQVYERILAAAAPMAAPEKKAVPAPTRDNPSRGPAGAKVVVQMFSDFQCPFCKRVIPTVEQLQKEFPGKIRLVWRNKPLPMHHHAEIAAEAAMEAFEQKGSAGFFAMYELLYAAQGQLDAFDRKALEGYAAQLRLDPVKFAHALDTQAHKAQIDADSKLADDVGISGTPAFVINGYYLSGAQPLTKFKKIVRFVLGGGK